MIKLAIWGKKGKRVVFVFFLYSYKYICIKIKEKQLKMIFVFNNYCRAEMAISIINNLKNDLMIYCAFYSRPEHSADVSGAFRRFTYLTAIMPNNDLREDLKEKLHIEYYCLLHQGLYSDEYDANVLADFIVAVRNICDAL